MSDPATLLELGAAGLLGLGVVVAALLHAWQQWLGLKRLERGRGRRHGGRGELAELRARVRKLEAIASGIEL